MWPQNGNSDSQVDIDTAAERASKYLPFRMFVDSNPFFRCMCMTDDGVSSRSGYFNLKTSISSLIRSFWIRIHSSWYNEDGSSYLLEQLPYVTAEVYGNQYIFYSGRGLINIPSRSPCYSEAIQRSRSILRDIDAIGSRSPLSGYNDHDAQRWGDLF